MWNLTFLLARGTDLVDYPNPPEISWRPLDVGGLTNRKVLLLALLLFFNLFFAPLPLCVLRFF